MGREPADLADRLHRLLADQVDDGFPQAEHHGGGRYPGAAIEVDEHTIEVAGSPVFYRRAPGAEVLYLHSVPTSSDDWLAPLGLTGGVAVDLPGFGRTGKGGHLDYSLNGYITFLERFVEATFGGPPAVVGHGWGGALALLLAQRIPLPRLAIVDAVPLLPGFRWPPIVRWWRRPGAGELLMGSVSRRLLARGLRRGSATAAAWPDARVDAVWDQFDQGTQRAILRLHRSADEQRLAEAGTDLAQVAQPALVLWGERDPWLDVSFADAYGRVLPGATVERIPGAGHWPWLDRPEVAERLAAFVT